MSGDHETAARLRLVFIAHYFPPMNSTGARRVTAFARYLAEWGHDVVVITTTKSRIHGALTESVPPGVRVLELPRPSEGQREVDAPSEQQSSSVPPTRLRRARRLLGRAMVAISGQLIDRELVFMARLLFDARVRREISRCDAIVSTSPPWVTHMAARILSRHHDKPWIADYRDQFSNSPISPRSLVGPLEGALDKWLARSADAVIGVSPAMVEYYSRWNSHTRLIYNGFDPTAVAEARASAERRPAGRRPFVLRFLGSYARGNPPRELLRALATVADAHDIRVELIGDRTQEMIEEARDLAPSLSDVLVAVPKVSADEALRLMAEADCLVLFETWNRRSQQQHGIATTKVFEYVATGRPVLAAVGPEVEAVRILGDSGLLVVASLDPQELAVKLSRLIAGDRTYAARPEAVARYSRPSQARDLERLLREVTTTDVDPVTRR